MLDMKPCPECEGKKLRKESLNVFLALSNKQKAESHKKRDESQEKQKAESKLENKLHASSFKLSAKFNISDLQSMPLNGLIEFLDNYQISNNKDKTLVGRICNPLIDRAKTIQDLGL